MKINKGDIVLINPYEAWWEVVEISCLPDGYSGYCLDMYDKDERRQSLKGLILCSEAYPEIVDNKRLRGQVMEKDGSYWYNKKWIVEVLWRKK